MRRRRGDLIQYFKIHHGINKVNLTNPNNLASALGTSGPASCLRGSNLRIARQKIKLCSSRENFLTNRIVPDWNNLPIDMIQAGSTNAFKNKLDKFNSVSSPSLNKESHLDTNECIQGKATQK